MNAFHSIRISRILLVLLIPLLPRCNMAQKTTLQVGDALPDFTLLDQDGKSFVLSEHIGKKPIVIYFYPKDETPGCTKEACAFRDAFEAFTDKQVMVIGISADDVETHKNFARHYNLPFTLLADTKNKVRKLFGVPKYAFFVPGRVTYIIDKNGRIAHIFNSMTRAEKHISEALRILDTLP